MTPAEFKNKWRRYQGKETSAYQEHFTDLCRLLGQPTPNEADASGTNFFCFQTFIYTRTQENGKQWFSRTLLCLDVGNCRALKNGFSFWKVSFGQARRAL